LFQVWIITQKTSFKCYEKNMSTYDLNKIINVRKGRKEHYYRGKNY